MIPLTLKEWNFDVIRELVDKGYLETNLLELKRDLGRDAKFRERLQKLVCAFANTDGGFIAFGIKDVKTRGERVIGIERSRDFAKEFWDAIKTVQPSIYFEARNPPIEVPRTNKVIHVIHIPRSPNRPHMTSKGEFVYRANGSNEKMNYQQIKETFWQYAERREKLKLLYIELLSNLETAKAMIIPFSEREKTFSLQTFNTIALESLLTDLYTLISHNKELMRLLLQIRSLTKIINNKIQLFFSQMALPLTGKEKLVQEHNQFILNNLPNLKHLLTKAMEILEEDFELKNPLD